MQYAGTRKSRVGGKRLDLRAGPICATGAGEFMLLLIKEYCRRRIDVLSVSLSFRKYGVAIPYKGTLDETPRRIDKRDGTPIDGPVPKKLKVSQKSKSGRSSLFKAHHLFVDRGGPCVSSKVVNTATATTATSAETGSMLPVFENRAKADSEVQELYICYPSWCVELPLSDSIPPLTSVRCHIGCYGIPPGDVKTDWLCEPCSNEKNLDASLVRRSIHKRAASTQLEFLRTFRVCCVPKAYPSL